MFDPDHMAVMRLVKSRVTARSFDPAKLSWLASQSGTLSCSTAAFRASVLLRHCGRSVN